MGDNIYSLLQAEVEHSGEGIIGCHLRNAKLFVWIEHSLVSSKAKM